jgi:hypothetical protein
MAVLAAFRRAVCLPVLPPLALRNMKRKTSVAFTNFSIRYLQDINHKTLLVTQRDCLIVYGVLFLAVRKWKHYLNKK